MCLVRFCICVPRFCVFFVVGVLFFACIFFCLFVRMLGFCIDCHFCLPVWWAIAFLFFFLRVCVVVLDLLAVARFIRLFMCWALHVGNTACVLGFCFFGLSLDCVLSICPLLFLFAPAVCWALFFCMFGKLVCFVFFLCVVFLSKLS